MFEEKQFKNDETIWQKEAKTANKVKKPTRSASYKRGAFMFWFFLIFFIGGMIMIWTDGLDGVLFYTVEQFFYMASFLGVMLSIMGSPY